MSKTVKTEAEEIGQIGPDDLLTSTQVGDLLQMNASSIKKWVNDGLIQAFRTPGGHRRIRASDLILFLRNHNMPVPRVLEDVGRVRVLLVDDNQAQLAALSRSLKRQRFEVVTANNGIDALVLVGSYHPQFVVLDVFMPDVDGLEVCRRLKKRPETRDIQVIVVSGDLTSTLQRKALEAGAVKCFEKPIDTQALISTITAPMGETRRAAGS